MSDPIKEERNRRDLEREVQQDLEPPITAEELDRKFDDGEDVSQYFDWANAKRTRVDEPTAAPDPERPDSRNTDWHLPHMPPLIDDVVLTEEGRRRWNAEAEEIWRIRANQAKAAAEAASAANL
jgi:hypothetical protein